MPGMLPLKICLPSPAARPPAGPDWLHEIKHGRGESSMRLIVAAEIPEPLCLPLRRFHVVLRESINTAACLSSVGSPAAASASRNSLILTPSHCGEGERGIAFR